ncbi:hypothetical protein BDF19DRAFT_425194 [Syncephalis fuscata]|nr:hypothetical protein BDF19DRAFT_425194 [Syncephalis fuscata]
MARTYKQTFMIFLPLWLLYLEVIQLTINDFSPFVDAACAQQNAVNECLRSATAAIKDCGMNSACACDQLTQRLACYTQCKDDIDFYNAGLSNERPLLIQACNDAHKVIKIPDPIPAAEAAAPGAEAAKMINRLMHA